MSSGISKTPILDEIVQYASSCINGQIKSGKKHIWACERLLNDLEKLRYDSDYLYYWDDAEAKKIVSWFGYLYHTKGVLAGQPITLNAWQKFRLCQIYGWRRKKDGLRRFKKSYVQVGRKNAKSQEEAGVALYEIASGSVKNGEIYECYTAGVKRDQSRKVFDEAGFMLRKSPLRSKFKVNRDIIVHKKTGSFIKPLSKDDKKEGDGGNPALFIIDEYHQHPTDEFYSLGAYGANTKEPLLMIITTAGIDLTFPCYVQEYSYCSKILDPSVDVENDTYFVDICELDPEDDIGDESNWMKANPVRATYEKGLEQLRENYQEAVGMPEKMPMFMTKCMNIWVQATDNQYMDMKKWKACEVKKIPYDLRGRPVYVGVDISSKIDLTSVSFIFPIDDPVGVLERKYVVKSHSFAPNEEKIKERELKDRVTYLSWYLRGFISVTNTPIVDQKAVMRYIEETCAENGWEIRCICVDPHNASLFMLEMSERGHDVEEVYQSYKHLDEAVNGFREQTYSGNILYEYNPVLNFAMSNAVTRSSNGYIIIDKDANKKKIDPVAATLDGFKLAMFHKPEQSWDDWTM